MMETGIEFFAIWICVVFGSQFEPWSIPLPYEMTSFAAGIWDDVLYITGGNRALNKVFSVPLLPNPTFWTPTPVSVPGGATWLWYGAQNTVQIDNLMYGVNSYYGSSNSAYRWRNMLIFNMSNKKYVPTSEYSWIPTSSAERPCVTTQNLMIYVLGGCCNTAKVQIYDVANDEWSLGPNMNIARRVAGCAFDINYNLFVFGGTSNVHLSSIETLSPASSNVWMELTETLYYPAESLNCKLYRSDDNKIYCVGGYDYSSNILDEVQIFDPTDYSISVKYLTYERYKTQLVIHGNTLLVLGGEDYDSQHDGYDLDSIEYITMVTETTTSDPTTHEPTTLEPTTSNPTTYEPTTFEPTTSEPTTYQPTTYEPTTSTPTTYEPTTYEPTTSVPTENMTNFATTTLTPADTTSTEYYTTQTTIKHIFTTKQSKDDFDQSSNESGSNNDFVVYIVVAVVAFCCLFAVFSAIVFILYRKMEKMRIAFSETREGISMVMTNKNINKENENKLVEEVKGILDSQNNEGAIWNDDDIVQHINEITTDKPR